MLKRRQVLKSLSVYCLTSVISQLASARELEQIWVEGDYSPKSQSNSQWLFDQIKITMSTKNPAALVHKLDHRGNPDRAIDLYHQIRQQGSKSFIVGGLHGAIAVDLSKLSKSYNSRYQSIWWPTAQLDPIHCGINHELWLKASIKEASPQGSEWGVILTLDSQGRLVQDELLKLSASAANFAVDVIEWRHPGDVEQLFAAYKRMRSMGVNDLIITGNQRDFNLFMERVKHLSIGRAPRIYFNPLPWATVADFRQTLKRLQISPDWPLFLASQSGQVVHLKQQLAPILKEGLVSESVCQTLQSDAVDVQMSLWSTL